MESATVAVLGIEGFGATVGLAFFNTAGEGCEKTISGLGATGGGLGF